MALMKSWVDTVASRDNMWLVLVFHGVDGIGWEPKTGAELGEYFGYIRSLGDEVWVATFRDAAKYMRERMHAERPGPRERGGVRDRREPRPARRTFTTGRSRSGRPCRTIGPPPRSGRDDRARPRPRARGAREPASSSMKRPRIPGP